MSSFSQVRWTAKDIPDLEGKHFVVTGGNSGLGLESVIELSNHGAQVTLAARNLGAAEAIAGSLQNVSAAQLDLADLKSIAAFAQHLEGRPVDVLMNNAGVMAIPRATTADGFEMQLGVNHLGHFALTAALWDNLLAAAEPRVVTVASNAHKGGKLNLADLNSERRYSRWAAYAQSKLANLLFARELARRTHAAGLTTIASIAAHPGYSATNLSSHSLPNSPIAQKARSIVEPWFAQSAEMGALPQLFAATAPNLATGSYVGPDGWGEWRGYPKLCTPSKQARDPQLALELWRRSCEMLHIDWL